MPNKESKLPLPKLAPFEWLLFEYLVDLAKSDLPCPKYEAIKKAGYASERIPYLVHAGYIEIIRYTKRTRVIRILYGEHQGVRTAILAGAIPLETVSSRTKQSVVTLSELPWEKKNEGRVD